MNINLQRGSSLPVCRSSKGGAMRRARIIPVALITAMLVFAVLAYRTWSGEQDDRELDRISEPFTAEP